jgi:putative hydrolase of the HAD superfamily
MSTPLQTVAFDADDTLWENETFYRMTEARFTALLGDFADPDHLSERLLAAERRNLSAYGFGIKGFTLSMIETAIEVTEGRVPSSVVGQILKAGRELHDHPIEVLPHAADALEALAGQYRIVMITKGDLFDQERKLAQSGLGDFFDAVEIVSDKTPATYLNAFALEGPANAMMVGNSVKSDVVPAIEAGAWGVHVPHELEWAIEAAPLPVEAARFRQIADLGQLPGLIAEIGAQ